MCCLPFANTLSYVNLSHHHRTIYLIVFTHFICMFCFERKLTSSAVSWSMFSFLFKNNSIAASVTQWGKKMYITTTFIMFECLVVMCFCKVGIQFVGQIFMCFIFNPPPHAFVVGIFYYKRTLIWAAQIWILNWMANSLEQLVLFKSVSTACIYSQSEIVQSVYMHHFIFESA